MNTPNENLIVPMDDQPAKPVYINEQHNHNCQQFYGPVTGCVFAMPGANVYQQPMVTPQPNGKDARSAENATCNPQPCKETILQYVMKLHPFLVRKEWQEKYSSLWESILDLPAVASKVYDKGRQQNTTFNRNLVGNILHLLAESGVLATANATKLSEALEGTSETSVRAKLGEMPADRSLLTSIEALLKTSKS